MKMQLKTGSIYTELWEFDDPDELIETAKKEARVCGDSLEIKDNQAEIYNWHHGGIRWTGILRLAFEAGYISGSEKLITPIRAKSCQKNKSSASLRSLG